ncbi:ATP-binding protein [Pandoraea sp. SD6-2]|uniref:ATP-binding protein n=1 Tax=Pandoraea sp. SD6-2 TaxID=1286093 RepID=UPI00032EFB42|nr:ATP-binding protein [Pandoraea sp. SD6-2]EON11194.1 capsular synthesis two-component sensor kinase and response regulator transcription protein [Pandoraea sp. SD6-2]
MSKSLIAKAWRYNATALLAAQILLSFALVASSILILARGWEHAQERKMNEFIERRERLELTANRVSARLMQFVDMYEGLWSFHERETIPVHRYQQALLANDGLVHSANDLTAAPFTILSDLTGASEEARLSQYLRIVRSLSSAPAIDARRQSGVHLTAMVYAPDGAFLAVSPMVDELELQDSARRLGRRGAAQNLIAEIENGYHDGILGDERRRPVWLSQREGGAEYAASFVIPMIRDGERVAMLAVGIPSAQFVQHFRNQENLPGFYVFSEHGDPLKYGVSGAEDRQVYDLVAREKERIVSAANGGVFWAGGALVIFQRVSGPDWIAVYVIPFGGILSAVDGVYWGACGILLLVLILLWGGYFFYRKTVAGPLERQTAQVVELESFRRCVLSTLPVGVIVRSLQGGEILFANNIICSLLETNDVATFERFCGEVARLGLPNPEVRAPQELEWVVSVGRSLYLGVTSSVARFDGGDVVVIGVQDVSDRRDAEALLQSAKAAAELANQAKSQYVAVIGHEIRTPLHGAMGNLELLAQEELGAEQRKRVNVIQRSFDGLLTLVNDMLDVAKIEGGGLKLSPRQICVTRVVARCVQNYAPIVTGKGLSLSCAVEPALDGAVMLDDHRFAQILHNLLSNATKFTGSGAISIRVRMAIELDSMVRIWVDVQDTGIGIAEEAQQSLFRALEQADETIARRFGGTGLGLYLCRQLALLMQGDVEVSSQLGYGARFRVNVLASAVSASTGYAGSLDGMVVCVVQTGANGVDYLIERLTIAGATVKQTIDSSCHMTIALYDGGANEVFPDARVTPAALGALLLTPDGPMQAAKAADDHWHLSSLDPLESVGFLISLWTEVPGEIPSSPSLPAPCHKESILIADDDEVNRVLLSDQLARLGYSDVRVTTDGAEALGLHYQRKADILLVDLNMPNMGGRQVLTQLRDSNDETSVIVVTAAGGEVVANTSGFSGILHKPVFLDALSRALELVSKREGSTRLGGMPLWKKNYRSDSPNWGVKIQMWTAFIRSWETDRDAMRQAMLASDRSILAKLLHRTSGALSALGNRILVDEAVRIGELLAQDEDEKAVSMVVEFIDAVDRVVAIYSRHSRALGAQRGLLSVI